MLELKERAVMNGNDTLLFKTYKLIIQQYVALGEKRELKEEFANSMLVIAKNINDNKMLATAYYSLGSATEGSESIKHYRSSLSYLNWNNDEDKVFFSSVLNNLSARYLREGDFKTAIDCADSAYSVSQTINRKEGMAASRYRSAEAYFFNEEFNKSIIYAKEALSLFKSAGILRRQNNCAKVVSDSYKALEKYSEALTYFEMKVALEDSLELLTESKAALFVDRKLEYELTQKKDSLSFAQEREINTLELENINNQLSKERMQKYLLFGGGALVLAFAVVVWIGFQRKRKDNRLIELQKTLVEEKNKEIMDSITYAKRIQSAILPPVKLVKEYLKDSFILYKPKEVVAGDFYWMETVDDKVLFAAADCTGHGVPGAMVSVVCNNALNRSVREHRITDPGEILNKTRGIVIQEFEKSEEDVKDGMDIAICSLNGSKLEYAGANNPLWIIRKGELMETKANKQPIGQFDNPEPYTTHSFDLEPGDSIYIFSDGYVDQFGGEKGKKYKAKAFKELLLSIQDKSMEEQKIIIDDVFEAWKGTLEQIDDVCVIGVSV